MCDEVARRIGRSDIFLPGLPEKARTCRPSTGETNGPDSRIEESKVADPRVHASALLSPVTLEAPFWLHGHTPTRRYP